MGVCLVTGGAGFIGSHVAAGLLENGHRVVVLDDLSGGFSDNVPGNAVLVEGSICDHELIEELFDTHRFDYVFHLAAYAAEGLSHFIRRYNYHNNLIGSVNLINAAVNYGLRCFVFTSSIAVYGKLAPPMKETMIPAPADPYGVAKLAVEQDLHCARDLFGLNYIVFRPHNVYGPHQNLGDRYRNVVGIFMNQLMQGKPLTVFGDGRQKRAFSYVDDVAPVIAASIDKSEMYNEVFNIGAAEAVSVLELAGAVQDVLGIKGQIRHLPARDEAVEAWSDHEKIARYFGRLNHTELEKGLKHMARWALQASSRKTKAFTGIEIPKGLPSVWREG